MINKFTIVTTSADETMELGRSLGAVLRGGEVLQLASDIGGGKTTFVKGLATGLGSAETVQSPTFIVSAVYECRDDIRLFHYDFYRLNDPGLMKDQLVESIHDPMAVTVIEWAGIVEDVLDKEVVTIQINASDENERTFIFSVPEVYACISDALGVQK